MPALSFRSRLLERRTVAERTMEFAFERPPGFEFRAGQALELTLLAPFEPDARGNAHVFSIASAPFEDTLRVASRMRDTAFKRSLHSLTSGAPLEVEGAFGSFLLHEGRSRPAAMLAGGIGVTPLLSMIRQALHEPDPPDLWLFCSNRRPEDVPYADDLRTLAAAEPTLHLVLTITRSGPSHSGWSEERGHLSRELLRRHLRDLREPLFYAAGPPGFVEAMRELLASAHVAETDLRTEEFSGY